jgi:hypothetical protein
VLTGGFRGLVVAKHDTEGNLAWAKGADGSEAAGSGIQADAQGNVYVSGEFSGTGNFGDTNLTSFGAGDVFLAKYAANGDLLWARHAGGTNIDAGNVQGLGLDQTAHCFWAAECQGVVDFSGVSLGQSTTQVFMVVAQYDPAGNLIWAKEKSARSGPHRMTADVNGNSYVLDNYSFLLSKHNSAGDTVWTRSFTNAEFSRVVTDTIGNCYFTGSFTSASLEFDDITLTNAGSLAGSGFVAKLATTTPPPLSIATSSNSVTLAWSALAENFYVESAPELGPATVWTSNEVAISTVGRSNILTLPLSGDSTFYRLKRP